MNSNVTTQTILAMVDRVTRIEPALRDTVFAVRQVSFEAVNDVWRNLAWMTSCRLVGDPDFVAWSAAHAANRVMQSKFDAALSELAECMQNIKRMDDEIEESERRELSLQYYRQFEQLKSELIKLVGERDCQCELVDAADLSCAQLLRIKVCSLKDSRLKQIARSAIDSALAAKHLARRLAVVKDHPPTLGDADFS